MTLSARKFEQMKLKFLGDKNMPISLIKNTFNDAMFKWF